MAQRPQLASFSTRTYIDADGARVFLTIEGVRSVLVSAASRDLAGALADPQLEIRTDDGVLIASSNDRTETILGDGSLPDYAKGPKDAAVRVTLSTGAYVVRVTGVGGGTGGATIDVRDSSSGPGIISYALRARSEGAQTPIAVTFGGSGNINLAWFLTGPNLPVTNPLATPKLTLTSGAFTDSALPITNIPANVTGSVRTPARRDARNVGRAVLWSYNLPGQPSTANKTLSFLAADASGASQGEFLFEIHDLDTTTVRPPVVYAQTPSTSVTPNSAFTLTALVGGSSLTSLRWFLSTNGSFTASGEDVLFSNFNSTLSGDYRVFATNPGGSVTSAPTTLTATATLPVITIQPTDLTVDAGQPARFSVIAAGTGLTYEWYRSTALQVGANTSTFFIPITQVSDSGTYAVVVSNAAGSVTSNPVKLTVTAPNPGRLVNLSLNGFAGLDEQSLIAGFVVAGTGGKLHTVRGIGPTLANFGVGNTLADPRLTLYQGANPRDSNDNWTTDDGRNAGGFPLPAHSLDAVINTFLAPGAYTVAVSALNNATGNALLEVYDGQRSNLNSRLINLSARTQLAATQTVIAGFVIEGETPLPIVIRAAGPALSGFGVTNAMADPKLVLYRDQTILAQNDNWSGDDGRRLGAFPLETGSKDSVIVTTLQPGAYTVWGSSANAANGGGVVVIELYEDR